MGIQFEAKCRKCGCEFEACDGGGFEFSMLRCDRCGSPHFVGPDEELPQPKSVWTRILELSRLKKVARTDQCHCGGTYSADAPLRCIQCHSDDIEMGRITEHYD